MLQGEDWLSIDGQDTQNSGPASASDHKDEKHFIFWIHIYEIKIYILPVKFNGL